MNEIKEQPLETVNISISQQITLYHIKCVKALYSVKKQNWIEKLRMDINKRRLKRVAMPQTAAYKSWAYAAS